MSSFSRFPASWLASPTLSVALKALALSLLVGLGSAAPGAGQVRGTLRAIDGDGNPVSNFPQSGGGLLAYVIKGTRRTATGNLGIFDGEGTVVAAGRKVGYGTFIVRSTTPTPVRDPRSTAGPNPRKSIRPSLVPGPRSTGRWTYILDESNPDVRALEPGQSLREFVDIYVDSWGSRTRGGFVDITIYGSPGAETDRIGDITDRDRLPVEQPPFRGGSSTQSPPFEGGGFPRSSKVSGLTGSVTKGSAEHSCTSPRPPREPRCQGSNYSTGGQIIDSNNPKGGPDTFVVQKNTQGKYGRFTIDAAGNWVYQIENDYPTTVALTEEAIDSFRVYRLSRVYGQTVPREGVNSQRAEYLEYQVEVTILPGSPPGRIVGTLAGSVTEDALGRGGEASGPLGVHNAPATFSKDGLGPIYGRFRLYNDRGQWRWTYTLDNSRAVTNRLNFGQNATETIGIRASNGATANIVITISGSDDPAVIGGTLAGTVTEDATEDRSTPFDLGCRPFNENDGTPLGNCAGRGTSTGSGTETKKVVVDTVRGELELSDVDDRPTLREEMIEGRYGTLRTIATTPPQRCCEHHYWEYTLDNDRMITNALDAGQRVVDSFAITVVTPSGNATAAVNITVVGSDDRSGIIGDLAGAVIERGTPAESRATGRVTIEDLDATPATLVPQDTVGTYGRFQALADGNWTYDIDNSLPATADLRAGETVRDIFPIAASDGGNARVIITVAGAEGKGIIGGDLRGIATELGVEVSGRATTTGGAFIREVNGNTTYGRFSIFSDGRWFYRLGDGGQEQATKAAEALRNKEVPDSFLIRNQGGDTARVTITIAGEGPAVVDVPSTIAGDLSGDVTEDDPAASRATGRATATVSNFEEFEFEEFEEQTDVSGTYGTFTIEGNGDWTYELDNGDPGVNALGEGQIETDSFVIRASFNNTEAKEAKGTKTTGTVTITITGADEDSEFGGVLTGFVTKTDTTKYRSEGTVTLTDFDTPDPQIIAQPDTSGTYGRFTIEGNGDWIYNLDISDPETIALGYDQVATDIFPITSSGGGTAMVTINVLGAAATLGGDLEGSVTVGDTAASFAKGQVIVMGGGARSVQTCRRQIIQNPVEKGQPGFISGDPGVLGNDSCQEVMAGSSSTAFVYERQHGKYGTFIVDSSGYWRYLLDNQDEDTKALRVGQQETETFEVKAIEQIKATVTITVVAAGESVDPIGPVDPIQKPISTYLQARSGALLGKQPGLIPFLKEPQPRSRTEGGISMQVVQDDSLAFEGSFVRDTSWGEVSGLRSGLDDNLESNDRDYLFATLGFHGQISATTLAGLMVQFDQGDEDLRASQGTVNGRGWRFGPYFVARDQRGALYVESRLLYGRSSNDIRFSAAEDSALRRGAFDTTSWLASIRLEGEMDLDYGNRVIRLIPHVDSSWVRDEVKAFTDDEGVKVPGQVVHFGEVKLGSDIEIPLRFGRREAMFTTGLSLVSTRESARIEGRSQAQQSVSDTHGRAELGLDYQLNNRIQLEFGGIYNDSDKGGSSSVSLGIRSRF